MRRATTLEVLSVALLSVALFLITGCGEKHGALIPNNPPGVRLTAFPPDSGTAGYDVEFSWEGWDTDGEVDHFVYSIDPPDMYGEVDSAWTKTDFNSGTFVFEASEYDTLYHWLDPQIAKSWHVFVIRAVDDMGAVSNPDYVAFNASTVAPRTQFTSPPPSTGIQEYMGVPQVVGLRVTFRWRGDDIDGLFTDVPVGYYLKVVDVTGVTYHQLAARVAEDTTAWMMKAADERSAVMTLDDGRNYAVAVRAIDEAGAIEPLLLVNGNMLWVGARRSNSLPDLTVRSTALGQRTWRGWTQETEKYEVPLGSRYKFEVTGNADWYGGLITGYSFGWDIEDVESQEVDPEGKGAWTPWSADRNTVIAEFNEERDYFLHVKCKDDGGGMALATMKFSVVQLEPTRNLCYIDDWRKYPQNSPGGEEWDDEVWQTMLEGYNYGEDWDVVTWDEWESPYLEHNPTLQFLSKFRVVVWSLNDNRSTALNQQSAWYYMNSVDHLNVLASYMSGSVQGGERGKVWAFGRGLVESSLLYDLGLFCEYPYPVDDDRSYDANCGIRRFTFASEFMHIAGEFDGDNERSGGAQVNSFTRYTDRFIRVFVDTAGPAIPRDKYTRPPAAELYPELPPRLNRDRNLLRGLSLYYFEVLEYPEPDQEAQFIFYDPDKHKMTNLIPLYRSHSYSVESRAHNKYCGFRYIPDSPDDPGEIVYFFFPMFPFRDAQIRATAKVVLSNWFGLPDPDAPATAAGEALREPGGNGP